MWQPVAAAICLLFLANAVEARNYSLRSAIGTNLYAIQYWSPQLPFIDLMKSSGAWVPSNAQDPVRFDLDANGWIRSLPPGQSAITRMLTSANHYPAGRYLVRYKGKGRLRFFDAAVVSQKPGEIVLDVTPGKHGISLGISAIDPADYLRDIEIIMPGGICEGDIFTHVASAQTCGDRRYLSFADNGRNIMFYPVFLDRLRAYSVLRFMNWMLGFSSESPVEHWSQRTPLSYRTWTVASGVPVEVIIALANRVGAHPWLSIPHRSDDAYARQLAQLVKAQLDPGLRVYVEYSNEVWNRQFAQSAYAAEQGNAQTPRLDAMQYYGLRSRTLGLIFKDALGAERVVAAFGAQAANPVAAMKGLAYIKTRFGDTSGLDAVAIAPYFGVVATPETASKYTAMTLDALFTDVRNELSRLMPRIVKDYRFLADTYGLSLVAYEGGQHMVGRGGAQHNDALNDLFHAFNRDPRIRQLYVDYLSLWKQAGGQLFVHYSDVSTWNKFGRWGALEYVAQPRAAAPKFDALQTFMEHNPVWWPQ